MTEKIKQQQTTFSPREIASMLGVSLGLVYRCVADGSIRTIKLGRIYRIPLVEKERLLMEWGDHA